MKPKPRTRKEERGRSKPTPILFFTLKYQNLYRLEGPQSPKIQQALLLGEVIKILNNNLYLVLCKINGTIMGRLLCLGRFTLLLLVALESAVDALDASSRRLGADVSTDMQDCASVACPLLFKEAAPAINLGAATFSSTQKRGGSRKLRAPPATMLELTRKLYGPEAQIGEPYLRYSNPYNKVRDESYKWTQVNEHVLESAFEVVGHPVRFIVEVGSFTGGSATQIGTFVRNRDLQTPVLAMDTWEGDVTMALGKYKNFMDKRHGQPQLYHQFLVNMIARNLSTTVLPFMVPSLVGARSSTISSSRQTSYSSIPHTRKAKRS